MTALADISTQESAPVPTGISEVDRVLGGGLVPGGVVLLAGEPGIGKSTLLLDIAARWGRGSSAALYVSAEESGSQVKRRADRIGMNGSPVFLSAQTSLEAVQHHVWQVKPRLLVLDSVQTVVAPGVEGTPGGVAQVRAVAAELAQAARTHHMATILVGHVTKDGSVAGPRTLEHLVDVVLAFEGERDSHLRWLRTMKNRYGPTEEVGCFEMSSKGLRELPDPSGTFLPSAESPVPGTCRTVILNGRRPMSVEIQALVASDSGAGSPRRVATGLDGNRLAMVLAVLERRAGVRVAGSDVYATSLGGLRVNDPGSDLALALALVSAAGDQLPPRRLAAVGEIGLTGEVRTVPGLEQRVAEAIRQGAEIVLAPPPPRGDQKATSERTTPAEARVVRVSTVLDALTAMDDAALVVPLRVRRP